MKLIKYIFIILIFSSCTINQYTRFLQDSKRLPQYAKEEMQRYRIQVDDELQVKILSLNKEVTSIFNSNSRYRVYTDGTIDIPFIDSIKVSEIGRAVCSEMV